MGWDLFDLIYDEEDRRLKNKIQEDSKEMERQRIEAEERKLKDKVALDIVLFNENIMKSFIILITLLFLKALTICFRNNLIISLTAGFFRIINFILTFGISLAVVFIGGFLIAKIASTNKLKSLDKPKQQEKLTSLSTVEKYIGVSDIKEELLNLKRKVSQSYSGEPGEDKIANRIINQCLNLLSRISNLKSALKIILERSEEYSLEEVIDTLKQAEESIGKNIFNITNRIVLELNIEGFDENQINKYLQNNEDILKECTKLVKESLEYIESKDNLESNTIGIETLTETLQSLKKQLNKGENS